MNALVANLHFLYIAYLAYGIYGDWELHSEAIAGLKNQQNGEEQKIVTLKKRIKKIKEYEENVAKSKARVEQVAVQIKEIQKQLPDETSDTKIMGAFTTEASLLNLQEPLPSAMSEALHDFYYSKSYRLGFKGTFLQSLVFFERLADNDRLFNVKQLMIKRPEEGNKGRFLILDVNATIETFRYNPNYKAVD